ncbi:SpaA isopeptide-forming pilin-related protein [Bifidobacterium biavatii]|uniref:Cell surface protein fimafimbrial subunit n=1 Tax=Bifidobacterium biavatii DSM 23969 TaxID=1437608 RepID=A0A087A4Q4_9BIFI|nr:SpaA isopeptide-forming pilin-related protein [Bifidobacterium biavatii]KFI53754.1 cell surface protein fimafimbrial subunit [Bifidobacterium biavatii DSM 23969]
MKLKKVFAGLAAAATMLGGLAFGASTAIAADDCLLTADPTAEASSKTITIKADDYRQLITNEHISSSTTYTSRSFTAIKLADYAVQQLTVDNVAGGAKYSLNLKTVSDLTVSGAISAALGTNSGYPLSDGDVMEWVSTHLLSDNDSGTEGQKTLRDFATALAKQNFDNAGNNVKESLSGDVTVNGQAGTLTLNPKNGAGVYLLIDASGDVTKFAGKIYAASAPIIIGTPVVSTQGTNSSCVAHSDGIVNIKNETVPLGIFQFTKNDGDGKALGGAKFVISKTVDGKTYYGKYNVETWDWTSELKPTDYTQKEAAGVFTSDATTGHVTFYKLPKGTYTITEVQAPDGFLQNVLPSFTIEITGFDSLTNAAQFNVTSTDQFWKLVSYTEGGQIDGKDNPDSKLVVKNVTSVTQLPLTGGAGIVLFGVIGAVLAGGAVLTFVRSRKTKMALMMA